MAAAFGAVWAKTPVAVVDSHSTASKPAAAAPTSGGVVDAATPCPWRDAVVRIQTP
jgi:hypothetical protein